MLVHGITRVAQLDYVCEADLMNFSMTWIEARQLKWSIPTVWTDSWSPGLTSVHTNVMFTLSLHVQERETEARESLYNC